MLTQSRGKMLLLLDDTILRRVMGCAYGICLALGLCAGLCYPFGNALASVNSKEAANE